MKYLIYMEVLLVYLVFLHSAIQASPSHYELAIDLDDPSNNAVSLI